MSFRSCDSLRAYNCVEVQKNALQKPDSRLILSQRPDATNGVLPVPTKKLKIAAAAIVVVLAGAAWWWFFGLSRQQVAELISVQGEVSIDGEAMTQPGWTGQAAGRTLSAGADGFAAIRLSDGSVTQVTPGARLTVARARQNAGGSNFTVDLKLDAGEVLRDVPSSAGGVTGAAYQVVGAAHANVDGRRDQV